MDHERSLTAGGDPGRATSDRGYTLIEAVIVVALIAMVVLPVLAAFQTSIRASSTSRDAARVETALVNATDRVVRAPKRCDYVVFVQAAVLSEGWDADRASVVNEYWLPDPGTVGSGTWRQGSPSSPGCPGAAPTEGLVQRVTITITGPGGRVSRTLQVVKSDV